MTTKNIRAQFGIALAFLLGFSFLGLAAPVNLPKEMQGFKMRKLVRKEIAPGVTYIFAHYDDGKNAKNFLNKDGPLALYWLVLEWDKCEGKISLNLARNPDRREMPTTLAKQSKNVIACVNGSYHPTTDPSMPMYQMKINGEVVQSKHKGYDQTIAFNKGEMPVLKKTSTFDIEKFDSYIAGDGYCAYKEPDFSDTSSAAIASRNADRAPRTFVGNNEKSRMTIIGVADGRQPKHSMGISCGEEIWLLKMWGCEEGNMTNLDGGGSSMMAIRKGGLELQSKPSNQKPERRVDHSLQIIRLAPGAKK